MAKRFLIKGKPGRVTVENLVEIKNEPLTPKQLTTSNINIYYKNDGLIRPNFFLGLLFIVCLGTIILLKFVFDKYFQSGYLLKLEQLISNLSFAFIASFIFYQVVIQRNQKIKNKKVYAVICGLNESVLSNGFTIKQWLVEGSDNDFKVKEINSKTTEKIKILCRDADISKIPNQRQTSICNLMIYNCQSQINFYIDKIFIYVPFLESNLIHNLNQVQNCTFVRTLLALPHKDKSDLLGFENDIIEFLQILEQIEKTNNKLKEKYLSGYKSYY